jgi:hypothetical protein
MRERLMVVGLALSLGVGAAYVAEPSRAGKGTTGAAVKPQAAIAKAKSPSPPANARNGGLQGAC